MSMEFESLKGWRDAAEVLGRMGRDDLAEQLLSNPSDRIAIIATAGGEIARILGWGKAVAFCEGLTLLTNGALPELD